MKQATIRILAMFLACAALMSAVPLRAQTLPPPPHIIPQLERKPAAPGAELARLIGDYGEEQAGVHVYERGGQLMARTGKQGNVALHRVSVSVWQDAARRRYTFGGAASGPATDVVFEGATLPRRDYGAEADARARALIKVDEHVIAEARKATPPAEQGQFRTPDLVSLHTLDPTIKLDIRYATPDNFSGYPVYKQAAAFMQRPAAEAVSRANRFLEQYGYGIAVHDSYRPWYVTKIFWDATPAEGKVFVADPSQGSRHNRGCAIDLTLYELATGKLAEMPGRYDEMSERSYPEYSGGTSLQRWQRDLLRYAMEQQGFEVYPYEWWHFDFKDWKEYPVLNVDFDQIRATPPSPRPAAGTR